MKRWRTIILMALLIFFCAIPVFAMDISDKVEISVNAKVEYKIDGEYFAELEDGGATVMVDDNITVTVTDAPKSAVRLIVTPIPSSEMAAWKWITACFKEKGTPIHVFDIHLADKNGRRINANGSIVTIDCPHCSSTPMLCSLTTSGMVSELNNNARDVSISFVADGSEYYIMAEKTSAPVTVDDAEDDQNVDVIVDVNFKDTNISVNNKPQTGDNGHIGLWITLIVVSAIDIWILRLFYLCRKTKTKIL